MSAHLEGLLSDLERRMQGAIDNLRKEFVGLRSGRASAGLLDPIKVEAYGSKMPLSQVGNVAVPEARMLTVSVWDKELVAPTEKAIRESGLGLNPMSEGQLIRIPIPALTEERRIELAKAASRYTENAKIAVRNIRKSGMDDAKAREKDSELSQDEVKQWGEAIQKLTDRMIASIDKAFEEKERDIKQV